MTSQFRIRGLIILFPKYDGWCLWTDLSCRSTWHYSRFVHLWYLDALYCKYIRERVVAMIRRRERRRRKKKNKKKKSRKEEGKEEVTSSYACWKLDNALTHEYETRRALRIQFERKIAVIFGGIELNTRTPPNAISRLPVSQIPDGYKRVTLPSQFART